VIAIQRGLLLRDPLFEKLRQAMPLERGLALGACMLLLDLITFGAALADWFNGAFGALTRDSAIRFVIASSTTLVLGRRSSTARSSYTFSITVRRLASRIRSIPVDHTASRYEETGI